MDASKPAKKGNLLGRLFVFSEGRRRGMTSPEKMRHSKLEDVEFLSSEIWDIYYSGEVKTEIRGDKKVGWTSENEGMMAVKELLSK